MAKILIVRLGAMGDIIHALPTVTGIRAALPEATIGWLVDEKWTELLTARSQNCSGGLPCPQMPLVNLIHPVNLKRWRRSWFQPATLTEFRTMLKSLKTVGYEMALDFQGAIRSAAIARVSGVSRRIGFTDPREPLARFLYSERMRRPGEHVIEQNHAFAAQALQEYLGEKQLRLLAPELPRDLAAEAWAQAEIKRLGIASFAIMNPGAGWGAKQWPAERYGLLAQALAQHNVRTLVNAASGEESLAQAVVEAGKGNAIAISSTVGQLIALTRCARIFVGGDTGPLHLAAALGIPVLGLYGPTDPARTGPFGTRAIALRHTESQTTFSHRQQPDEGLLKITADETIAAARQLLGSSRG